MLPEAESGRRFPRFWRTLGITYKFGLAFSLLLALVLVAALVNLGAQALVRDAEADILVSLEIRQKVFEMDGGLEKARRLYRDFLINYPEEGFARARELYGQPALAATARVIAVSEELRNLLAASNVSNELRNRNVDVTLYLSLAKRFSSLLLEEMSLLTALADPADGLEARMNVRMEALKTALAPSKALSSLVAEAHLYQLQYLLLRQRPLMQSAFNVIAKVALQLPDSPDFDAHTKRAISNLLTEYAGMAEKVLEIDVAMRCITNDFGLQAATVDPISQELKALSGAEAARFKARIEWISVVAGGVILLSTVLGMVCAFGIASLINASVTRKIVDMTKVAAEMRAGNLNVTVKAESDDEIGVLADTFNSMSRRVKDLVENLEDKVRQRTRELDSTNRELDRKNHELEVLSLTDRLTGLCNRRKLDETLRMEMRRFKRYRTPFSLVMLDVDHFKVVNDTHGHQVGDAVLARLADTLTGHARETDIVGRWGGEEFLVVCPETGTDTAMRVAERLRREVEETVFPLAGRITASFGVTECDPGDDVQALLARVDRALYKAKRDGRNHVATA